MKLDRNDPANAKRGKYALLNLRRVTEATLPGNRPVMESVQIMDAISVLDKAGLLDWGVTGSDHEFFVLRLRDIHSKPALQAYATSIAGFDLEFAAEVQELAKRSGYSHPNSKQPD